MPAPNFLHNGLETKLDIIVHVIILSLILQVSFEVYFKKKEHKSAMEEIERSVDKVIRQSGVTMSPKIIAALQYLINLSLRDTQQQN